MNKEKNNLARPLALVTGASRGIGAAIAWKLAQHGWDLILTADRTGNLLQSLACALTAACNVSATPVICDMADPAAVRKLFADPQMQHLDLLVNNAGISWVGVLQDMSDDEWARILNTNLSSMFYTCRAAIPIFLRKAQEGEPLSDMDSDVGLEVGSASNGGFDGPDGSSVLISPISPQEAQERKTLDDRAQVAGPECCPGRSCPGRIINISSVWGNVGASCEAAYAATKGGVNAFTRALGKELAPSCIPVNAIACGCVDTVMNDNLSAEEKAALSEEIPAGRFASPGEIAAALWQLVNAPAYLTGQVITVDGGWI